MSPFDAKIEDLLESKAKQIREIVKKLKAEKDMKIAALDKELSCNIATWEGQLAQLEELKDLKWDHYAKLHLEKHR